MSVRHLNSEESSLIETLIDRRIFKEINRDQITRKSALEGFVLVACSDGDHFSARYDFYRKAHSRIHPLALNGGAILFSEKQIGLPLAFRDYLFHEILEGSLKLKNMRTVVLESHLPCGMAGALGVDFKTQLSIVNEVLGLCENQYPRITFIPSFHVCHSGNISQQSTWFFDRKAYAEFTAEKV